MNTETPGTSNLTPAQTAELEQDFGYRYTAIQDNFALIRTPDGRPLTTPDGQPVANSRKNRRALGLHASKRR